MGLISVKEFDFRTRNNVENSKVSNEIESKESMIIDKDAVMGEWETKSKTQVRTRTWETNSPNHFPESTPSTPSTPSASPTSALVSPKIDQKRDNIMEIQEINLAEAHAKMLTAQREYAQQKRVLNQLYESFNVPTIEE